MIHSLASSDVTSDLANIFDIFDIVVVYLCVFLEL